MKVLLSPQHGKSQIEEPGVEWPVRKLVRQFRMSAEGLNQARRWRGACRRRWDEGDGDIGAGLGGSAGARSPEPSQGSVQGSAHQGWVSGRRLNLWRAGRVLVWVLLNLRQGFKQK